jgi:hypothetical protein
MRSEGSCLTSPLPPRSFFPSPVPPCVPARGRQVMKEEDKAVAVRVALSDLTRVMVDRVDMTFEDARAHVVRTAAAHDHHLRSEVALVRCVPLAAGCLGEGVCGCASVCVPSQPPAVCPHEGRALCLVKVCVRPTTMLWRGAVR